VYNFAIQYLAFNTNQDMHARRNSGEFAWLLLQDFQFMNTKLYSALKKERKSTARTGGGKITATVL